MLKKGVTLVKFTRPASAMRLCLQAVENDQRYKDDVMKYTKLNRGKVDSALRNLAYIGAIIRTTDKQGRSVYQLPGRIGAIAPCLLGIRSIFDVSTDFEKQCQKE